MLGTIAIYLAVNWVSLRTLGLEGVRASNAALTDVAAAFMGERTPLLVAGLIILSVAGAMSVSMLATGRLVLDWQRAWIDVMLLLIAVPAYFVWRRYSRT